MTSLATSYTPLESLLLFQTLRSEGLNNTTAISFSRISDQLKSVPLVRSDPTYDGGRLGPDALKELYLGLVKEEVKRDIEHQLIKDDHVTNGDGSPASRKRKAPSPTLPTVSEAARHSHLIPQLITRLYTRYRENTVRQLREYERRYHALSGDVNDVEAGRWDERLQKQHATPALPSPKPSTTAHTQPSLNRSDHVQSTNSNTASPVSPHKAHDATVQVPAKRYSQAKIDAVMNHGPEPQPSPALHRRTSSNTTLPPLSEMAPQSPHFGIASNIPGSVAPMPLHMQHAAGPGYSQSPPAAHQSPYASHHAHPAPSPHVQIASARPSSSPRLLPPPPGMKLLPPGPVQHPGPSGLRGPPLQPQQHYQPQHRSSMGPSPTSQTPQHAYPPQGPPPASYYPQQPYQDRRPSYPPAHATPQQYSPHPQPQHMGGHQLQPFYVNAEPAKQPLKQRLAQQQAHRPQQMPTPVQRQPAYSQYPNALATGPRPHAQNDPRLKGIVAALATPPRPLRKPLWKSERRPVPVSVHDELPQPEVEPLSPVQKRVRPAARPAVTARKRDADPVGESAEPEVVIPVRQGRKRQERDRGTHSDASSTTEDPAHASDRSHSVTAATRPESKGKIKNEPLTTADTLEDSNAVLEPAATPAPGPMTRKRRGTIQSQPQPQPASKRKRQDSPSAAPDEELDAGAATPPPRPTTITATRNLARMAATIMNDITSHKHASYFATPVRNKDANGYSDIIKQPQNLKSIRAALTAGTRAVAAALDSPSATPTASTSKTGESSTTVELERSSDLMPPKAIVNGAQLEREVYKMLCNAVMFNPGEDGLVADTREMFEDVEAKIREWRGAERDAGAAAAEEEDEGKAKRRKL